MSEGMRAAHNDAGGLHIDAVECLRRGAIGAFGAIPGTLSAHPFDVVKMRQQVGGAAIGPTVRAVGGPSNFYRGVGAGVSQKIATRGPMFLVSEACTQQAQRTLGIGREKAVFVGSALSGYVTGSAAAIFEWRKVQRGAAGSSGSLRTATLRTRLSIINGAGMRNSVFDSIFFGSEYAARQQLGLPAAASYACAAVFAMTVDFPLDSAVKGMMAAKPDEAARGGALASTWRLVRERRLGIFNGLRAKACEFAVSYAVTGFTASYVLRALENFL